MNSKNKTEIIKNKFKSFFEGRTEEQKIKHDADMLMASFLSEIELVQKQKNIKKKKLADLIKISPSYLTQVFNGNKPLNFYTLAKIIRALDIKFSVQAHYNDNLVNRVFVADSSDEVSASKVAYRYDISKFRSTEFQIVSQPSTGTSVGKAVADCSAN